MLIYTSNMDLKDANIVENHLPKNYAQKAYCNCMHMQALC
jgi:hypothetical protein